MKKELQKEIVHLSTYLADGVSFVYRTNGSNGFSDLMRSLNKRIQLILSLSPMMSNMSPEIFGRVKEMCNSFLKDSVRKFPYFLMKSYVISSSQRMEKRSGDLIIIYSYLISLENVEISFECSNEYGKTVVKNSLIIPVQSVKLNHRQ